MRTLRFFREEGGQSLIVIAASFAVLVGAVALSVDWGYSLAERRAMTNAAQAGALAAGKLLATSVVLTGGSAVFNQTQQNTYCEAVKYVALNRGTALGNPAYSVTVQYGTDTNPIVWTTSATSSCPATGTTMVPASTRFVRVTSSVTYRTLLASAIGQETITASASARARVSGARVVEGGDQWPMVRHFDPSEFLESSCGNPCNPDAATPVTFWSTGNEPNMVYGSFKGMVDMSRYSGMQGGTVPSLLTDWDQSGTTYDGDLSTNPKTDRSGNCNGGIWDTYGTGAQGLVQQCSIPNWFYYGFKGELSLEKDWRSPPGGAEAPSPIGARPSICAATADYIYAPSCASPHLGDWLERPPGNLGNNLSSMMCARIAAQGRVTQFSNNTVQGQNACGTSTYGRALTILVYLWDCAEAFDSSAPLGSQWSLIQGQGNDCARISAQGNAPSPDRVHIFAAAPFTFYEGLVSTSSVRGFWGGGFGDPNSCPSGCALNALSNTTFLVPDD